MATEEAVRWHIKVSKETDQSLRSFLDPQGMKKDDLSEFIEQAVLKQVSTAWWRTSTLATAMRTLLS